MVSSLERMLVKNYVAVLPVVMRTRVSEMKILGNGILAVSISFIVLLELYS